MLEQMWHLSNWWWFLIKEQDYDVCAPWCPVFGLIRQSAVDTPYTKGCSPWIQKFKQPKSGNYKSQSEEKIVSVAKLKVLLIIVGTTVLFRDSGHCQNTGLTGLAEARIISPRIIPLPITLTCHRMTKECLFEPATRLKNGSKAYLWAQMSMSQWNDNNPHLFLSLHFSKPAGIVLPRL